jgi:hypothetical protein
VASIWAFPADANNRIKIKAPHPAHAIAASENTRRTGITFVSSFVQQRIGSFVHAIPFLRSEPRKRLCFWRNYRTG